MLPSPIPESISQLFALILILFWPFPHLFPEAAPSHSSEWLGAGGIRAPCQVFSLGLTCRQVCGRRVVSPPPAFCSGPWFGR